MFQLIMFLLSLWHFSENLDSYDSHCLAENVTELILHYQYMSRYNINYIMS